jgi:hypothetical protein
MKDKPFQLGVFNGAMDGSPLQCRVPNPQEFFYIRVCSFYGIPLL